MNYDNRLVRRQDRLLDEQAATNLLKTGPFGVLSMRGKDTGAYGVPLSYAWNDNQSIYVHCAPEGRKLSYVIACNNVSFCVVGYTKIIASKFTTAYESIILNCTAHADIPPDERMEALALILEKYSKKDKAEGLRYAQKSFSRTHIIRLDIQEWSGKCKRVF